MLLCGYLRIYDEQNFKNITFASTVRVTTFSNIQLKKTDLLSRKIVRSFFIFMNDKYNGKGKRKIALYNTQSYIQILVSFFFLR